MNREELLKRCVDRRVAHETSVVAVSHLFYVYLLSALKKGQRVEVPNFGTFGTRVVGAKRQRRMPYFEVEEELANKVNERYRNLKTLLIGRYEMIPIEGEVEYSGREPRYDRIVEEMGEPLLVDTDRDITPEEYRREVAELRPKAPETEAAAPPGEVTPPERPLEVTEPESAQPPKERELMPKEGFDLRDKPMEEPTQPVESREPMPTLREISGGEGMSPLMQILIGIIILGVITVALNEFGFIHLWGKFFARKVPQVTETLPAPPVQAPPAKDEGAMREEKKAEPTPTPPPPKESVTSVAKTPEVKSPEPRAEIAKAPSGTGKFTVQVSSWTSTADADRAVSRWKQAGFDAYVVEAFVNGRTWYRVRVGRYTTMDEARQAAEQIRGVQQDGVWVTRFE